jgi:DNA polymerase-4
VSPDKVALFVEHLPLKKIPGIGPKTAIKLKARGFSTCKDVRESNVIQLQLVVGKFASALYQRAFGQDERSLEVSRQRKSLAIETTFSEDIVFNHHVNDNCQQVIDELYIKLIGRLEKHSERCIVRQGIKLKFSDFNQTTVEQQSISCDKQSFTLLLEKALTRAGERSIRLIGLTLGFEEMSTVPLTHTQLALPFDLSPLN